MPVKGRIPSIRLVASAALTVAAIGLAAPAVLCRAHDALAKENPDLQGWGKLWKLPDYGFLKSGAKLFSSTCRIIAPEWRAVFLRAAAVTRRLETSRDLAGYVRIRSAQEALAYAEFLTSRGIRMTVVSPEWRELHVAAVGDAHADYLDYDWKPGEPHRRASGMLHEEEWKANRLSEPVSEQRGKGFALTRWLWTIDTPMGGYRVDSLAATNVVWLVVDYIASDGGVREKMLGKRKLSGVELVTPILR